MTQSQTMMLLIVGLIVVVLMAVVGLLLIFRRRRKTKQKKTISTRLAKPVAEPAPPPPEPAPVLPPQFINDPLPADGKKPAATPLSPLPMEKSLAQQAGEGATPEKIRILVVDDNRDTTENVSRLIYFEDDMEVIGQAYTGREGVAMAEKHHPHIVLMDINMPDMDGITATREMSVAAPFSQVIIMSVQSDQQYMRQAMVAGAKDFQPKPFTADELVSCIRRVYKLGLPIYKQMARMIEAQGNRPKTVETPQPAEQSTVKTAPVLAIYSPKGGIGTSSLAASLALVWQKFINDIVLVDGDLEFGDLMVHLNLTARHTIDHLVDDELVDNDVLAQILVAHPSGLKLLPAPQKPELAELVTPEMLKQIIEHLKLMAKLVVIDTGSHLSNQTLTMLEAVDYIVLITTAELTSIKSAKLFIELLQKLKYPSEKIIVVLNQADMEGTIPQEQIKKVLRLKQLYAIPYEPKIGQAINRGQSILELDAGSPAAKSITQLAQHIWRQINQPATG